MKLRTCLLLSLFILLFSVKLSSAQITSSGIAVSTPVTDPDAQDGDIICTYQSGNARCNKEYDTAIYGVISDSPAAAIEDVICAEDNLTEKSKINKDNKRQVLSFILR